MYEYPFTIRKLTKDEGGGYLAEAVDLQGCMSDGETIEEASKNLQDAITSWIEAAKEWGDTIPKPSSYANYSGKFLFRFPKRLHKILDETSKLEGVSINTLLVSIVFEGIGNRYIRK